MSNISKLLEELATLHLPRDQRRLVKFLDEGAPVYSNKTVGEVSWIRGYAILKLAESPLPEDAWPAITEELQSGLDAYLVACAARAARSGPPPPGIASYIERALFNIWAQDGCFCLENARGLPAKGDQTTSAVQELLLTAVHASQWDDKMIPTMEHMAETSSLGFTRRFQGRLREAVAQARAVVKCSDGGSCCACSPHDPSLLKVVTARFAKTRVADLEVEDQDGMQSTFGQLLNGRPAVVAFFYTRCDNPSKCSMTVSRLAELQGLMGNAPNFTILAFTYDPQYDLPRRLQLYGANRGFQFGQHAKFLRTSPSGLDLLRSVFQLGVNYTGALVNRHRIEVFLVDANGKPFETLQRLQWTPRQVLSLLQEHEAARKSRPDNMPRRVGAALSGILPVVAFALVPKCPLCVTAWLGTAGMAGLAVTPSMLNSTRILFALFACLHVAWIVWRAVRTSNWLPVSIWIAGALLVFGGAKWGTNLLTWGGVVVVSVASFLALPSAPKREFSKKVKPERTTTGSLIQ